MAATYTLCIDMTRKREQANGLNKKRKPSDGSTWNGHVSRMNRRRREWPDDWIKNSLESVHVYSGTYIQLTFMSMVCVGMPLPNIIVTPPPSQKREAKGRAHIL